MQGHLRPPPLYSQSQSSSNLVGLCQSGSTSLKRKTLFTALDPDEGSNPVKEMKDSTRVYKWLVSRKKIVYGLQKEENREEEKEGKEKEEKDEEDIDKKDENKNEFTQEMTEGVCVVEDEILEVDQDVLGLFCFCFIFF
jgi:hypothetical protein